MDFRGQQKQQISVAPRQQPAVQQPHGPSQQPVSRKSSGKRRALLLIIGSIMLVAFAVSGWLLWQGHGSAPRNDRYQAVFLEDDQVFFGKLVNTHGDYLRLEQPYSTRASDVPEDATPEQKEAIANNLSLIKVANMVYGPEDVMMIRAEKVRYWQDLQPDSKVAKALSGTEQ